MLLRPLDANADAEPLYAESHPPLADPGLWTYLPNGPYRDPAELRDALRVAEASEDPLFFTLVRLPGEEPAGVASYLRITPDHGVIEIGHIWFGASLRRTTAATEAIYLLAAPRVRRARIPAARMEVRLAEPGLAAGGERFGFRFEGVFRNHMVVKGRNRDTAWFAITDDEWPAVRAGFETWLDAGNLDAAGHQKRGLGELIAGDRA